METNENELTREIIGAAIQVHRALGPGLLESVYEECLAYELAQRLIQFERQKAVPVTYRDVHLDCGFRIDLMVQNEVVVELKSVEAILPIHKAQVLTYLKLTGQRLALLINFNVAVLNDGIVRLKL